MGELRLLGHKKVNYGMGTVEVAVYLIEEYKAEIKINRSRYTKTLRQQR